MTYPEILAAIRDRTPVTVVDEQKIDPNKPWIVVGTLIMFGLDQARIADASGVRKMVDIRNVRAIS